MWTPLDVIGLILILAGIGLVYADFSRETRHARTRTRAKIRIEGLEAVAKAEPAAAAAATNPVNEFIDKLFEFIDKMTKNPRTFGFALIGLGIVVLLLGHNPFTGGGGPTQTPTPPPSGGSAPGVTASPSPS